MQTTKNTPTAFELSEQIFNIPTAPYYEKFVLTLLKEILDTHKIPYFSDSSGNLIAGYKSAASIPKKAIALAAHTDHPGFHVTKKLSKGRYQAKWYGGAPFSQILNAKLRIHCNKTSKIVSKGTVSKFPEVTNHRDGIEFEIQTQKDFALPAFGAFDFSGFKLSKDIIVTKAADDLAGCVMALKTLIELYKKAPLVVVFTRAEEVGFVGCLGLIQKKVLPLTTFVISLEASRTLPGALLGHGPVIRLGDASTLFDSNFSLFVQKCAQTLKTKDKEFLFQKRIMDGGSCEATAFSQFGYTTMGLAVPLDNYHNMGKKGPAPEKIHKNDLENGAKLLVEVCSSFKTYDKFSGELKKRLSTLYKNSKYMLKEINV